MYDRSHTRRGRLEPFAVPKPNRRDVARDRSAPHLVHPTAQTYAQQRRDGGGTSSAPITQPPVSPLGINRIPSSFESHITKPASRVFLVPVLQFPLEGQLFEPALEVFGKGYLVGRFFACPFPAYEWASGGRDQEVAFGRGRAEVEGRLDDGALESTSQNRSGGGPLSWTGKNTVCEPQKIGRVISGVDAVGGK